MKIATLLLASIGLSLSLAAQPAPPAKGGAAGQKAKKEAKEEAKIEGIEVARPGGGFLGVQIVGGAFKMNFYDAEKKPTPPDVARAVLRWDPKYKVGQERIVLNPGGSNVLTAPRAIRPPYNFKLFIVLLKDPAAEGAEAPAGESYVIDFRQ